MKQKLFLISIILALFFCLTQSQGNQQITIYDISVKILGEDQWHHKGVLTFDSGHQYKRANVNMGHEEKIISNDLLKLVNKNPNKKIFIQILFQDQKDINHFFITNVNINGLNQKNKLEILELVKNIDDELISINYVTNKKEPLQEDYVKVKFIEPQESFEILFNPTETKKKELDKTEMAQQAGIMGFIRQYFWYIAIGFGVFYLISSVDPEKMSEKLSEAQQQQQQQVRR